MDTMGTIGSGTPQVSSSTSNSVGLFSRSSRMKVTVSPDIVAPETVVLTTVRPYSTISVTLVAGHGIVEILSDSRISSTTSTVCTCSVQGYVHTVRQWKVSNQSLKLSRVSRPSTGNSLKNDSPDDGRFLWRHPPPRSWNVATLKTLFSMPPISRSVAVDTPKPIPNIHDTRKNHEMMYLNGAKITKRANLTKVAWADYRPNSSVV